MERKPDPATEAFFKAENEAKKREKLLYKELENKRQAKMKREQELNARYRLLLVKGADDMYTKEDELQDDIPVDGDVKRGTQIFTANCASCHSMVPQNKRNTRAPSLGLVYLRKAGTEPQHLGYSSTLLSSNFYWTTLNLFKFLGRTSKLVEAIPCGVNLNPIYDAEDRSDLIALFREYSKELQLSIKIKEVQRIGIDQFQSRFSVGKAKVQIARESARSWRELIFAKLGGTQGGTQGSAQGGK